ncbi:unnamed protein product [Didymodactylos carnosus]|uniref:N-acetyltransferase domain-containing protein n=1 Tax=Didymodactylos carnosus TaxID=1234261 RepID=A0A816E522_9BILA|nr:unnamed protein product [Didymodactylos carnosus]CAF1645901.1 unnamed protein product [Didymodactylos carnosus]CAF3630044.1 unnamed protein product [Didymodactylos carnosus]CAF4564987.1 unnamed protein product [Didymodactylos carnosus]
MTDDLDDEDGRDFWNWIETNYELSLISDVLNTFFVIDKQTNAVLGTGSIVKDDRDMGKKYGLDGIWLGGININRKYRSCNLGTILVQYLHQFIQQSLTPDEQIIVNLFTDSEQAKQMYIKLGYQSHGQIVVEHFNSQEELFRKIFK